MHKPDLAIFVATSGHSGVDRIVQKLLPEFTAQGLRVDVLRIEDHGPYLDTVPTGARVVPLHTSHVASSLPALVRYLRKEKPRALLTDKDKVNRLAIWARRLAGVPTRLIVRTGTTVSKDLETRHPVQRWLQYASMHYFYPWADAIVVPSRGAALDIAEFAALPVERISVIQNPIVTPALDKLADEPVDHPWFRPQQPPVILGVGELCGRKDFATLIHAFALVRKKRQVRLMILGRGRQKEKLWSLAQELGVQEDVSLPGFVANPYAYMKKASLFAQSSRHEGFGNVLAEALAVGTPVVSTDCPSGPREILQDGRYGTLVPVGDVSALADAIQNILEDPPLPAFLRQAAEPFRAENIAKQYMSVMGIDGG